MGGILRVMKAAYQPMKRAAKQLEKQMEYVMFGTRTETKVLQKTGTKVTKTTPTKAIEWCVFPPDDTSIKYYRTIKFGKNSKMKKLGLDEISYGITKDNKTVGLENFTIGIDYLERRKKYCDALLEEAKNTKNPINKALTLLTRQLMK